MQELMNFDVRLLLERAREIWGPEKMELRDIMVRLGVTVGDLNRLARDGTQGKARDLKKELGNIIFSTIRWCDDLGFTPEECISAAIDAQRAFVESGKAR